MSSELKGIIPAIASPCDECGNFLEKQFVELLSNLYRNGADGLFVCGGTGDGYKMSIEDRKCIAQIAIQESKKFGGCVIVQVGSENLPDTLELAEHSSALGADAISSLPPAKMKEEQLISYYSRIANVADIPLMAYYMPSKIGEFSVDVMARLLDIDGLIGFKITDWNLFYIQRILLRRPDAIVFNGMDECLFPSLFQNVSGGIGMWYNIFPQLFVKIYQAMKRGNINKALNLHNEFLIFADFAWTHGLIEVFELLIREKNIAENCFRHPKRIMENNKKEIILPELRKRAERLEHAIAREEKSWNTEK